MTRVEIRDVSVRYGALWAVRDVTLDVAPGEVFFLLGPSGCGKTTLLRAVAGLARPAAGEVLFDGRPMNTVPSHERNIGFVFQNYALWPHLTVAENVEYGLVTRAVEKDRRVKRVRAALAMMGLLGLEGRYPGELSGGQQQRVAVARATVIEPDLLLMDEPLSNLDARLRAQMRGELKALVRRLGVTTVYVTHDQREALSMADRVAVMRDGRVVQCAAPRKLYFDPTGEFTASFVGEANVVEGKVVSTDGAEVVVRAGRWSLRARAPVEATGLAASFAEGEIVNVLFRPEDVGLAPESGGENQAQVNVIEGRVVDIAFVGGDEEVMVEDPDGRKLKAVRRAAPPPTGLAARAAGAKAFEEGDAVAAVFPSERAHAFRAGG